MDFWIFFIIFCIFVSASEASISTRLEKDFRSVWTQFKQVHSKTYRREEEYKRRSIWNTAILTIIRHNLECDLGKHHYRLGLNKYSDLTTQEFVSRFNGYIEDSEPRDLNETRRYRRALVSASELPSRLDWRDENIVTPVKDQEQCGSCWAHSSLGALEAQVAKTSGKVLDLSEQNLVDCSSSQGNRGCRGGRMTRAFKYIIDNKGVEAEETYPYKAKAGQCRFRRANVAATCSSYENVESGNEEAMLEALVKVGPISVAIDASRPSFQRYKTGIYDDPSCSSTRLDHAVLLIGYGTEDGIDYWLIKNSYGTSWGESGYAKVARNRNNLCGLATHPSYPIV